MDRRLEVRVWQDLTLLYYRKDVFDLPGFVLYLQSNGFSPIENCDQDHDKVQGVPAPVLFRGHVVQLMKQLMKVLEAVHRVGKMEWAGIGEVGREDEALGGQNHLGPGVKQKD